MYFLNSNTFTIKCLDKDCSGSKTYKLFIKYFKISEQSDSCLKSSKSSRSAFCDDKSL